jgi:TatA/E family protein of Tat protein translocase
MFIQPLHLVVILFILLLIFGGRKLGDLGKALAEAMHNFRGGGPGGPKPA